MARDRIHDIRRLFMPIGELVQAAPWQPLIDVYRTREGWLVKADLAGVRTEDIAVSVHGTRLTIRGVRRDCTLDEGCCHYRLEISYSRFERTIELPDDLERADITSELREGMLLVRIRREVPDEPQYQ
jgi:HSP20 family protein